MHHLTHRLRGFTLIELLVVLAVIGTLLTIALPRYFRSVDQAKEVALKQTLSTTRDAIDKFIGDTGQYPETLTTLVENRYLRHLPFDPIVESDSQWTLLAPPDPKKSGVYDLKSNADGRTHDGTPFAEL